MNTEPYNIRPWSINRRSKEFKPTKETQIIDGDWDTWNHSFTGTVLFYESFKYILKNVVLLSGETISTWEQTPYYQYVLRKINNGEKPWGCSTVELLNARCKKLEAIFEDIRDNGWKDESPIDRVGINIDRNGDILFNNGRHRLTFALLLRLPKIPVNINVVHKEWQDFKDQHILYYYNSRGKIYAPIINHPDLEHLKSAHGHDRWETVRDALVMENDIVNFAKGSPALDIGAHWGYFSHQLANCGYDVTAVEVEVNHFKVLRKLSSIYPNVKCIRSSIFDMPPGHHYGVVLSLNIFHHFLKTKELYDKLIIFLRELSFEVMFFQPHNPKEGQMKGAYVNFTNEEFVWWIQSATGKKAQQIGKSKSDNRPIYKIS